MTLLSNDLQFEQELFQGIEQVGIVPKLGLLEQQDIFIHSVTVVFSQFVVIPQVPVSSPLLFSVYIILSDAIVVSVFLRSCHCFQIITFALFDSRIPAIK